MPLYIDFYKFSEDRSYFSKNKPFYTASKYVRLVLSAKNVWYVLSITLIKLPLQQKMWNFAFSYIKKE